MPYETNWVGLLTPSWERPSNLARFRRHSLLNRHSDACPLRQGTHTYCISHFLAARRDPSRSHGERDTLPQDELISHDPWLRRFSASPLPTGASFRY